MNVILWLPRLVYKLIFFLLFLISLVVLYPIFYYYTVKESRFNGAFKAMQLWAILLQSFGLLGLKIEGKEHLKSNSPYILCANHASYLDIIMMYRVMPSYFVMMGKGEIKDWPLFNRFFTTGMNILVNRESRVASHKAFELAKLELDKKRNVVIFPEGGIPDYPPPKMRAFKNGAFKMAIEKQVPIVPMTYVSNYKLLQSTYVLNGTAGPGLCKVIVHKPIETKGLTLDDVNTLKKQVYAIIDIELPT